MIKWIALSLLVVGCSSHEELPQEPELFRPNYNLTVDNLLRKGYVREAVDDVYLFIKRINDTTTVKIEVNEELGIISREFWEVKFKKADIDELNLFLYHNSAIIVTEMCDGDSDMIDDVAIDEDETKTDEEEVTHMNFNFFVQAFHSYRFFQCNFGDEEDGSALLRITHDHPSHYRDGNNPCLLEVFGTEE